MNENLIKKLRFAASMSKSEVEELMIEAANALEGLPIDEQKKEKNTNIDYWIPKLKVLEILRARVFYDTKDDYKFEYIPSWVIEEIEKL